MSRANQAEYLTASESEAPANIVLFHYIERRVFYWKVKKRWEDEYTVGQALAQTFNGYLFQVDKDTVLQMSIISRNLAK